MDTSWVLHTDGDPVARVRRFLGDLWAQAHLDQMLVPVRQPDGLRVTPLLLDDPAELSAANPLAPVMVRNCASDLVLALQARPETYVGAVLHPCEVRALVELSKRHRLALANILVLGIDCLATFNAEEYTERARRAGGDEALTRETLRFARQGGILLYRNRPSCQMCETPSPQAADISLELFGLPVMEKMLVQARTAGMAEQLRLGDICDSPAPRGLVARRQRLMVELADRRSRALRRLTESLANVPATAEELLARLQACQPCQACLDVCPICSAQTALLGRSPLEEGEVGLRRWLASCAGCGMCEEVCPEHMPLAAIMRRLHQEVVRASGYAAGRSLAEPLPVLN